MHFAERAQRLTARFANDPHRPQYHFLPPANWMNDPNGLIQWRGKYHMFYQYNPNGPFWGTIEWGHAISSDLVHWAHLPVALVPTPGGPDAEGCWSGCAIDHDGTPTFIYTGFADGKERPCIATSRDDGLVTWEKWPGNPVIQEPPAGLELTGFRDHSAWKEGDTWYQVVGAGIKGLGGTALLYRSHDLRAWEYMHPLCVGDRSKLEPLWTGAMWECVNFFALGDRHVLVISVWDDDPLLPGFAHAPETLFSAYMVGTYKDHLFTPEAMHYLDFGGRHFYAPQSFEDERGRRILFGWIQEGRSKAEQLEAGWSGVMSLPRGLTLREDGRLGIEPAAELQTLRASHSHAHIDSLAANTSVELEGISGDTLELSATFEPGDALRVGLKVRSSPGGQEETLIYYDVESGQLVLDTRRSSLNTETEGSLFTGKLSIAPGEQVHLRVFLDRSVIEVYAQGTTCITGRVYPSRADSQTIHAFAEGDNSGALSVESWEMRSIW